jgi:Skp family chaperone for outer membrane proteins
MITRSISAVAAVATLTAGLAWSPDAAAQELKVGYVNVKQVLRDYDKTLAINETLRAEQDKAEKDLAVLREELRQIDTELNLMVKGTARYRLKKRERVFKAKEIETHREWTQYELGQQMAKSTIEVYKDLIDAVRAVSEKGGYQLVLKIEEGEIKGADTGLEVNLRINTRTVLYYDDSHDLTDQVLTTLNESYKKSGGKAPPKKAGGEKKDGDAKKPGEGGSKEG